WKTMHRGPLLIHAGLAFADATRELCVRESLRRILAENEIHGPADLPRGAFVGSVTLEDCVPTDDLLYGKPDAKQFAWTDIRPGQWAWKMSGARRLDAPVPYQGVLGLFEVPDHICSPLDSTTVG